MSEDLYGEQTFAKIKAKAIRVRLRGLRFKIILGFAHLRKLRLHVPYGES
jgi:hypothetical protein